MLKVGADDTKEEEEEEVEEAYEDEDADENVVRPEVDGAVENGERD